MTAASANVSLPVARRALVTVAALGLALLLPAAAAVGEGAGAAGEVPARSSAELRDGSDPRVAAATKQGEEGSVEKERASAPQLYTKDQVVYVKTDASGNQEGVYVINAFDADADVTVRDAGVYRSITNLTDTQNLVSKNGLIRFDVARDELFLYQGELAPHTTTPWTVAISYTLNGMPIEPQDLAGASGRLEMRLDIAADERQSGPYAQNYLLQVTGSIKTSVALSVSAPQATVAQAGNATSLTYLVFPQEDTTASYTLEAVVKDFEFDGWQIVGVPLAMSVDVGSEPFKNAVDEADELSKSIASANDGASTVSQGAEKLSSSITETLLPGAEELAAGSSVFSTTLARDAQDARAAAATVDIAAAQSAYDAALAAFVEAYAASMAYGIDPGANQEVLDAQAALQKATAELVAAQAQVAGYDAAASALERAFRGYSQVDAAIQELVNHAAATGLYALQEGAAALASGSSQLAQGTQELAEKTSDLGQRIEDEAKTGISDFLNPVFTPVDFVSGEDGAVKTVQFVYMTAEISKPKPKVDPTAVSTEQAAHDEQGFLGKLADLFK